MKRKGLLLLVVVLGMVVVAALACNGGSSTPPASTGYVTVSGTVVDWRSQFAGRLASSDGRSHVTGPLMVRRNRGGRCGQAIAGRGRSRERACCVRRNGRPQVARPLAIGYGLGRGGQALTRRGRR